MQYTVAGFSQKYAITLKRKETIGEKEKTIQIDCTDLIILRWFVDFYPNMEKITIDGKQYAKLVHGYIAKELPILDISKRAIGERFQKLVSFGILTYHLQKSKGLFCYYGFGENYKNLISSKNDSDLCSSNDIPYVVQTTDPMQIERHTLCSSNDIPYVVQTYNKDSSIIYPSIKDSSIKILDYNDTHYSLSPQSGDAETEQPKNEDLATVNNGWEISNPTKNNSCPYKKIMNLYNEICVTYSKIRDIVPGSKRAEAVQARWRYYKDIDIFRRVFELVEASDFLKGTNNRNWTANFDWIMNPSNFQKILENRYDNKDNIFNDCNNQNDNSRNYYEQKKSTDKLLELRQRYLEEEQETEN